MAKISIEYPMLKHPVTLTIILLSILILKAELLFGQSSRSDISSSDMSLKIVEVEPTIYFKKEHDDLVQAVDFTIGRNIRLGMYRQFSNPVWPDKGSLQN